MPAGSLAKTLLVPGDGHLLQGFGRLGIKQAPVLVAHGPRRASARANAAHHCLQEKQSD